MGRTETGSGKAIILNGLNEFGALVVEVEIAAAPQVFHQPEGVDPITVRDPKDRTRGTGDAGLGKRTRYAHLRAVCTFWDDLETE
jgi:hypothetical protein